MRKLNMKSIRVTYKDGFKVIIRLPENAICNIHEMNYDKGF